MDLFTDLEMVGKENPNNWHYHNWWMILCPCSQEEGQSQGRGPQWDAGREEFVRGRLLQGKDDAAASCKKLSAGG